MGKELFFSYFGIALSNLSYKNYSPILRKGRRIGYKGLVIKSDLISNGKAAASEETKKRPAPHPLSQLASTVTTQSKISKTVSPSEKPNPLFKLETVKQWMGKYYCEGGINEILSKQDLWLHFKDANQLQDSEKSAFFSHLGNMIGRVPFEKVQPVKRKHKTHAFQFLKNKEQTKMVSLSLLKDGQSADKANSDEGKSTSETEGGMVDKQIFLPDGPVSRNSGATRVVEQRSDKEEQCPPDSHALNRENLNHDMNKSASKIAPTIPDSPLPCEGDVTSDIDEHDSAKDDSRYEMHQIDNSPGESLQSMPDSPNPSTIHMDMGDRNDENAVDDTSRASYDSNASCDGNAAFIDEVDLDKDKETPSFIFERFHRNPYSLLSSNLPGKPASFQAYLSNVLKDPGNTNEQRVALYLASGSSHAFKDCALRAFVAASFPPVKVGSFAGEQVDFTFEGDALPQFAQLQKSNFRCAICIPHLKWALDNSIPHAPCRAKSASKDAILSGTAKLSFSGMVQLKEHANSKCHLEALDFFKKAKEVKPSRGERSARATREKLIYDYFLHPSEHLN